MTTAPAPSSIVILQPAWVSVFGVAWIAFLLALFAGTVFSTVLPMQVVLAVGALITIGTAVVGLGVRLRRDGETLLLEHGRAGFWRVQHRWPVSASLQLSARPFVSKNGKDRYWIVDVASGDATVALATRTEKTARAAVALTARATSS